VGTVVYSALEGWSVVDSLYFSVVALATVGFGDLVPTTDVGKLFTVGYIITGIGILAAFARSSPSVVRGELATRRRLALEDVEHEVGRSIVQTQPRVDEGSPPPGHCRSW
jgi:voltage-gated potassium channel Kch